MASGLRILFLTGVMLSTAGGGIAPVMAAAADGTVEGGARQVIKPELERRQIDIGAIDTEDYEVGAFGGLLSVEDFGANMVLGFRLAYHVTEGVFFEGAYGQSTTSKTSFEKLNPGAAPLLTDEARKLTYYNISLGYNLFQGETFIGQNWAFPSAVFVIAGVGNTNFADDDHFTINYGLGYRFLATDWLALHFDVRDHMFEMDLFGVKETTHNLETTAGMTVFF